MGRVPHEHQVALVPGPSPKRSELAGGVREKLLDEIRDELSGVGKLVLEEGGDLGCGRERLEARHALERQKEGTGEAAVLIGQRDEHERAAWPNVKRMLFELPASLWTRRQGQFLVAVAEEGLLRREPLAQAAGQVLTHGRTRTVGPDHQVFLGQSGVALREGALEGDVCLARGFGCGHQELIQPSA